MHVILAKAVQPLGEFLVKGDCDVHAGHQLVAGAILLLGLVLDTVQSAAVAAESKTRRRSWNIEMGRSQRSALHHYRFDYDRLVALGQVSGSPLRDSRTGRTRPLVIAAAGSASERTGARGSG